MSVSDPTRAQVALLVLLTPVLGWPQVQTGEIRLWVADPAGLALPSSGTLASGTSQTRRAFETDDHGRFAFQHLAPGLYQLIVEHPGFSRSMTLVEVRSAVPAEVRLTLAVEPVPTELLVTDAATLLDPHRTGVAYSVGPRDLREQQSAIPGRGLLDLVDQEPGWLFEANAVLHPRGSEYQTLLVVDGIPMDENRSPGFAPDLPTGEVSQMAVLTGNYPAEYGRKLGGIIEVVTASDSRPGFHGDAEAGGGSFGSASGLLAGTYGWSGGAVSLSASGARTRRFLDPPVTGNFTNAGTADGASAAYEWDISDTDRLHLAVARRQSLFEVPNENLQQAAGQRQDRNGREDLGQAAWTHEISSQALLNLRASIEDLSANLWSNALATPIVAFQQRGFRRGYFSPSLSVHRGRHDFKIGGDAYYAPVSEALAYRITDPSYFDDGTLLRFNFSDRRLDREQSLFAAGHRAAGQPDPERRPALGQLSAGGSRARLESPSGRGLVPARGGPGGAGVLRSRVPDAGRGEPAAGQFGPGGQRQPAGFAPPGAPFARQFLGGRIRQTGGRARGAERRVLPPGAEELRR